MSATITLSTKEEILAKLQAGEMSVAEATAALNALDSANAKSIYIALSDKGAFSLYGLNNRNPVTLYHSQMVRLLDYLDVPANHHVRKYLAVADKLGLASSKTKPVDHGGDKDKLATSRDKIKAAL